MFVRMRIPKKLTGYIAAVTTTVIAVLGVGFGCSGFGVGEALQERKGTNKIMGENDWMAGGVFNPEKVIRDTFTDIRDNVVYTTVKIGDQTWMAENLNYNPPVKDNEDSVSWCYYNDSVEYCDVYGRLYTWEKAKSVCPDGWHLPTHEEWKTLVSAVGGVSDIDIAGMKLKSVDGWKSNNGTNNYSFTALPGGFSGIGIDGSREYTNISERGYWWTADNMQYLYIYSEDNEVYVDTGEETEAYSVRCILDPPPINATE